MSLGAAASAAIFACWVVALLAGSEGSPTAWPRAAVGLAFVLAAAAAGSARRERLARRLRPTHALILTGAILLAIASIAVALGTTPARAASAVAGRVLFTSLGEEVFFRGYVQSRANVAFGRPFRILGVACGPGILISSALFGLVHLLNPTLYFSGRWEVSWTLGAAAFGSGLCFGFLREMTASIWAGCLIHGTSGACGAVR